MFLPEGDRSEESFFEGIEKMAYPDRIKNHGRKVGKQFLQCRFKKTETFKDT